VDGRDQARLAREIVHVADVDLDTETSVVEARTGRPREVILLDGLDE
jgi:hypothetical protein